VQKRSQVKSFNDENVKRGSLQVGTQMPSRSSQPAKQIRINRAPVLTLWAVVVAERLGFDWHEALTFGRAVAGLNAYAKGKALGIFHPKPAEVKEKRKGLKHGQELTVNLLHRAVPAVRTPDGMRALSKGKPIAAESVERYLKDKFGEGFDGARKAMVALAHSLPPGEIAERAYDLYVAFRPEVPAGVKGWGAAGVLDLGEILKLRR
jgi:hypothetical protein